MSELSPSPGGKPAPSHGPQNYEGRVTWEARPGVGLVLRFGLAVAPIVVAFLTTLLLGRFFVAPEWSIPQRGLWALAMFALATVVASGVSRSLKRLVPLGALCQMNLSFPTEAPSRLKTALRLGNSANTAKVVHDFHQLGISGDPQTAALQTLHLVEALNQHDRRTRGHSERVRALADVIAEEMGLPEGDRNFLRWASLLHDVGKLSVPPEILNKRGKPTKEEWKILEGHPWAGHARIAPLKGWLGDWALCIEQHHERFDGSGYPKGLRGEDMPLGSRIVAVADAFEVMTATRSNKKPMSFADARAELVKCSGTQFDPAVVRALVNVGLKNRRMGAGFLSTLTGELAISTQRVVSTFAANTASASTATGFVANLGAGAVRIIGIATVVTAASTASLGAVVPENGDLTVMEYVSEQPKLDWDVDTVPPELPEELAFVVPAGVVDAVLFGESTEPPTTMLLSAFGSVTTTSTLAPRTSTVASPATTVMTASTEVTGSSIGPKPTTTPEPTTSAGTRPRITTTAPTSVATTTSSPATSTTPAPNPTAIPATIATTTTASVPTINSQPTTSPVTTTIAKPTTIANPTTIAKPTTIAATTTSPQVTVPPAAQPATTASAPPTTSAPASSVPATSAVPSTTITPTTGGGNGHGNGNSGNGNGNGNSGHGNSGNGKGNSGNGNGMTD